MGIVGPIVFIALVLLWELGARMGWISALILPAPSAALGALEDLV